MLKQLFLPTKANNHRPFLLSKIALVLYTVFIIAFNFSLGSAGYNQVKASVKVDELIELHNQERAKHGLTSLKYNDKLSQSATLKANVMMTTNCWSHYCPESTSPWTYFDQAGYSYVFAGENLAEGFQSSNSVMNAWMNSTSHRNNIINSNFSEIGIGFAYGKFQGKDNNQIVVVHFAKPIIKNTSNLIPTEEKQQDIVDSENYDNYKLTVNAPVANKIINSSDIYVQGSVQPSNSDLTISINEKEVGRIQAEGENFTYRSPLLEDGEYNLNVDLIENEDVILSKSINKLFVEGTPPSIINYKVNIEADQVTKTYTIKMETSKDVTKAFFNEELFTKTNNDWVIKVDENYIKMQQNYNIKIEDSAGNSILTAIPTESFNAFKNESTSILGESSSLTDNIFNNFFNGDIRILVYTFFIIYLIILFAVDYYVLLKTSMISIINRKSHIQLAIFIILLLIVNLGGISGSLLTGINI